MYRKWLLSAPGRGGPPSPAILSTVPEVLSLPRSKQKQQQQQQEQQQEQQKGRGGGLLFPLTAEERRLLLEGMPLQRWQECWQTSADVH